MAVAQYNYSQIASGFNGPTHKNNASNPDRIYGLASYGAWSGKVTGTTATMNARDYAGVLRVSVDGGAFSDATNTGTTHTLFSGLSDTEHEVTVVIGSIFGTTNGYWIDSTDLLSVEGASPSVDIYPYPVDTHDPLQLTSGIHTPIGGSLYSFDYHASKPSGDLSSTGGKARFSSAANSIRVRGVGAGSDDVVLYCSIDGGEPQVITTGESDIGIFTSDGVERVFNVWADDRNSIISIQSDAPITAVGARLDQFGDSITFNASGGNGEVETHVVAANLGYLGNCWAVSGWTVNDLLLALQGDYGAHISLHANRQDDIAVLAIGRNSTAIDTDTTIQSEYSQILTELKNTIGYKKVLCRGILPEDSNSWTAQNAMIESLVDSFGDPDVVYVDVSGWTGIETSDGVHPNGAGYDQMESYALASYAPLLQDSPTTGPQPIASFNANELAEDLDTQTSGTVTMGSAAIRHRVQVPNSSEYGWLFRHDAGEYPDSNGNNNEKRFSFDPIEHVWTVRRIYQPENYYDRFIIFAFSNEALSVTSDWLEGDTITTTGGTATYVSSKDQSGEAKHFFKDLSEGDWTVFPDGATVTNDRTGGSFTIDRAGFIASNKKNEALWVNDGIHNQGNGGYSQSGMFIESQSVYDSDGSPFFKVDKYSSIPSDEGTAHLTNELDGPRAPLWDVADNGHFVTFVVERKRSSSANDPTGLMRIWKKVERAGSPYEQMTLVFEATGIQQFHSDTYNGFSAGYLFGASNGGFDEQTDFLLNSFEMYSSRPAILDGAGGDNSETTNMGIVFDGNGYIAGFTAYLTGDFDVTLPTIEIENSFRYVFSSGNSDSFLQIRDNETRLRLSSGATLDLPPISLPATITDGRITRVGSNITFTFGDNTVTANTTAPLDIREWGRGGSGGGHLIGRMSGIATIIGDASGDITHDFGGGVQGDTQLTNTSGDYDHGNLTGFTTGGYEAASTPTPSVANAGADQSNINAGDIVELDSSASTGVVSRSWSEVTSTGVTLSDSTAVRPTFTAPSFNALTEITFRVTTTGSDGTTDFDDVSLFVLEDGVVVADPTITILTPYAYQTKKADALFEAIFTLSGTITDLPAGAVAEYQVDGGNWIQAPTDSNGNFSTDVVITKQQNITVRVSTNTDVTDTVSYITAAHTWLAWWQSNESGRGASTQNSVRNELDSEDIRPTMFKDGVWQRLADPTSEDSNGGSTWVRIAVEFAKIGIPIGLLNVAVGGTSLERWLPSSNDLWDSRIIAETTEADCGGITYTASLGGESNVGTAPATMRLWLEEMMNALHTEFGSVHYLTDIPRTYANGESDNLRAEFDYVIDNNPHCRFGGDIEVVDLTTSGDGTHLNSSAQVNEAALIRFAAFTAEQVEENQPPTANAGPDQSVAAGVLVQVSASGSSDGDGTIVGYKWRETTNSGVVLSSTTAENISFTSPVSDTAQTVTLELIVTDDDGVDSAPVYVNFNVAAEVVAPTLETLSIEIKGSGTGSHEVTVFLASDISTPVYSGLATFVNDRMVVESTDFSSGQQVVGLWLGNNYPATGGAFYGVVS